MSVGMPDMDMETIPGVHAIVSHSPDSYINSAKQMVATVDTQCHILGSTQGSDRPTQPTIKEGSVANSDTFGECHNLGFTQGSDGLTHATLQDGPGKIVDTTPGERTHVTCHEGSIVTAPRLKSNKFPKIWVNSSSEYNVCSSGNKRIQKESAKIIKEKKEKSVTTIDTVDPHPRNGYNAQLAITDNDTKCNA